MSDTLDEAAAGAEDGRSFAAEIRTKRGTGKAAYSTLRVDQRVLARITDGIYRRPSSAFRELISNAYDADATYVEIRTDAPRFDRVIVSDNGAGMSPEALANLIHHIGGSSKRTAGGGKLNTVDAFNPELSPKGRRLIGKIGIGIFSIAQLSQHFQIITKRAGDDFRTSADIVLRTYSEENLSVGTGGEAKFTTGEVAVTTIPTSDTHDHGTDIVIMDLRLQAREQLRSSDKWRAADLAAADGTRLPVPAYHIGEIDEDASVAWQQENTTDEKEPPDGEWRPELYRRPPSLPWKSNAAPAEKFRQLFDAVKGQATSKRNPAVEESLDEYLATLWRLSLAVPVNYIGKHPFHLTSDDGIAFYKLSEKARGAAEPIYLDEGETIGARLGLEGTVKDPCGGFRVVIDDVELLRPIAFEGQLQAKSSVPSPLMFFGRAKSNLGKYPAALGGGGLEFDAYLYWNSRIIPKENNGVLIRINRSSGVLFDETFMDYKVSELNRLAQISSEVFISIGLDPALNIDRESFNNSHPHYQWVQRWVHAAVKQATNRLKGITKDAADLRKQQTVTAIQSEIAKHSERVWTRLRGRDAEEPPDIILLGPGQAVDLALKGRSDSVVLDRTGTLSLAQATGASAAAEDKIRGLVTILEAYSLLEQIPRDAQQQLIDDILTIFAAPHD